MQAKARTSEPPAAIVAPRATGSADADVADRLRAAIGRLARRLRPTVAASGLTPSQISILFTIARRGPLGLSELAELEAMNPTMLSRIVAQLSELGLIQRDARSDDRRAGVVTATAAGRRVRERVHRERAEALGSHLHALGEDDRARLLAALPALERLVELMDERRR
jgi:DNA-binding MarR family transcriptional regulator